MRRLMLFIKYIPSFYWLWKEWGMHPDNIDFALRQYIEVISRLTNGKLSKLCYSSPYIVDVIREYYCDDCDLKEETNANRTS